VARAIDTHATIPILRVGTFDGPRLDIGWVFDRRNTEAPTALDPRSRDNLDLLASADSRVLRNVGDALGYRSSRDRRIWPIPAKSSWLC